MKDCEKQILKNQIEILKTLNTSEALERIKETEKVLEEAEKRERLAESLLEICQNYRIG